MVHQRQRLALGLEPGDDLPGVHAKPDDLERDPAADGFFLLGHVDRAAAALADLLEELVAADHAARGVFRRRLGLGGPGQFRQIRGRRRFEKIADGVMGAE